MMTISEFASLGGRARWKGKTKKEKSEMMKELANKRHKPLSPDASKTALDEQARRV